tara:strand:+ start:1581 stop:1913 length:333 start_codon:yes stop_codon:yes gene_type:complete
MDSSEKNIKACVLESKSDGEIKLDGVKILVPVERINTGVFTSEIEMNLEEAEKLLTELTVSCLKARHYKETGGFLTNGPAELGKMIVRDIKISLAKARLNNITGQQNDNR